ncbi:MAG TPA: elongator complex protein 3, partial [Thermoplasmata archaeon]|nr:elongator complex protein 3 [Thermoplasmata archaeon]
MSGPAENPPSASPGTPEAVDAEKRLALRGPGGPGGPLPSNVEWEAARRPGVRPDRVLRKPTRTLSGVAVVAVMTAPAPCPHGRCTYCPGGVELGSPQSYTGEEPSALRGAQFGYDPWSIVTHRLESLEAIGHPTSKVEAIVMGGTFPSRPRRYRETVFRGIYDGLNGTRSATLEEAQRRNETADRRLVGLTVETRPDWCDGRVLPDLLDAGVTRIELGVECLDDAVLSAVGRAHDASSVVLASRAARDQGLKVGYHMMLGLPGMDPSKDEAGFRRIFEDADYCPDFLKIYPTLVLPATPLYEQWQRGEYRPYDTPTAVELLARIKARLPPWVRVHRIQRDIPVRLVADGVRSSNIRQLALDRLASRGERCRCLRCREVGRSATPPPEAFEDRETRYPAAGGHELFLSREDPDSDLVAGYLRLRFPSDRSEGGLDAPVIRELKVLGAEVPIG